LVDWLGPVHADIIAMQERLDGVPLPRLVSTYADAHLKTSGNRTPLESFHSRLDAVAYLRAAT
jgi:hypothetical protein